jgi:hypothetical protein
MMLYIVIALYLALTSAQPRYLVLYSSGAESLVYEGEATDPWCVFDILYSLVGVHFQIWFHHCVIRSVNAARCVCTDTGY